MPLEKKVTMLEMDFSQVQNLKIFIAGLVMGGEERTRSKTLNDL